jgi:hypothetical protein
VRICELRGPPFLSENVKKWQKNHCFFPVSQVQTKGGAPTLALKKGPKIKKSWNHCKFGWEMQKIAKFCKNKFTDPHNPRLEAGKPKKSKSSQMRTRVRKSLSAKLTAYLPPPGKLSPDKLASNKDPDNFPYRQVGGYWGPRQFPGGDPDSFPGGPRQFPR